MQPSLRNAETLYQELQALRRLAEIQAPPEHPPAPPGIHPAPAAQSAERLGAGLTRDAITRAIRRMLSLFEPVELVRQVAPGQKPQARDEWDNARSGLPKPGIF